MDVFVARTLLYAVAPLLFGWAVIRFDPTASDRPRRIEALLVTFFIMGVAGGGFGGFVGHVFLSDSVAESIGWEPGNPFQWEVGFANLAIGLLGAVAAARRDGFREATVVAATVFSVGATITHVVDIVDTGNLAPGNTLQNVSNLIRPAILITLLVASRRADAAAGPASLGPAFDRWRLPLIPASVAALIASSTGFAVGTATDQPVLMSVVGLLVAVPVFWRLVDRSHGPEPAAAEDRRAT